MKRDLDLCRAILFAIEQHASSLAPAVEIPGYSREQIEYHEQLLADAGLVIYATSTSPVPVVVFLQGLIRMTWAGHDFLDAARQPARWQKAKAMAESAGGVTFEVLKAILARLVTSQLGL